MVDNVTPIAAARPVSPWRVITIGRTPGADTFDVAAWDDAPSKSTKRLYLGSRESVLDASIFAHAKAAQLNVWEVADLSDADWYRREAGDDDAT